MIVSIVVGGILLAKTKFGYHVFATGGDCDAARNWGINVGRKKVLCFMLMGALCGLSGALLFGWLQVAAPITGTGLEFSVIAAVILGGAALQGGQGSIYGSLVGAVIIGMITSGLVLMGFSQDIGDVATGLLIAAVHTAGLASLTHTPSPMGFMNEVLGRPKDLERPYMLLVVGYPAPGAVVPDIKRLPLEQIATFT